MTLRCYFLVVMVVISFFLYSSSATAEMQRAFNKEELQKFCQELPIILASMNDAEKDKFFRDIIKDHSHAVVPEVIMQDSRLSLQPQRVTYILFHILLAGVIEDIGGFGEGQLAFVKQEREKVKNNPRISANEKERLLKELENNITHLNEIIVLTKSIPNSELVLLWQEKDTLNPLLRGIIPIKPETRARQQ